MSRNELFAKKSTQDQNRSELFSKKATKKQDVSSSSTPPRAPGPSLSGNSGPFQASGTSVGSIPRASGPPARAKFTPTLTPQQTKEKEKEAEECKKQGLKLLERTISRWKPDFLMASSKFETAAKNYRAIGKNRMAISMLEKAGSCQVKNESYALAAKDFKEAALLCEMEDEQEEASQYFLQCANAWQQGQDIGKAAENTSKAAKIMEDISPSRASELYLQACKLVAPDLPPVPEDDGGASVQAGRRGFVLKELDDIDPMAAASTVDVFHSALMFMLSTQRYAEAVVVLACYVRTLRVGSSTHSLFKMYFVQVAVALRRGDYVAADSLFRDVHIQHTEYLYSPYCKLAEQLLMAHRSQDLDGLRSAAQDPTLRHLDQPIQKVVREIALEAIGQFSSMPDEPGALTEEEILLGTGHEDRNRGFAGSSAINPFDDIPSPPARSDLNPFISPPPVASTEEDDDLEDAIAAAKQEAAQLSNEEDVELENCIEDARQMLQDAANFQNRLETGHALPTVPATNSITNPFLQESIDQQPNKTQTPEVIQSPSNDQYNTPNHGDSDEEPDLT